MTTLGIEHMAPKVPKQEWQLMVKSHEAHTTCSTLCTHGPMKSDYVHSVSCLEMSLAADQYEDWMLL